MADAVFVDVSDADWVDESEAVADSDDDPDNVCVAVVDMLRVAVLDNEAESVRAVVAVADGDAVALNDAEAEAD